MSTLPRPPTHTQQLHRYPHTRPAGAHKHTHRPSPELLAQLGALCRRLRGHKVEGHLDAAAQVAHLQARGSRQHRRRQWRCCQAAGGVGAAQGSAARQPGNLPISVPLSSKRPITTRSHTWWGQPPGIHTASHSYCSKCQVCTRYGAPRSSSRCRSVSMKHCRREGASQQEGGRSGQATGRADGQSDSRQASKQAGVSHRREGGGQELLPVAAQHACQQGRPTGRATCVRAP